MEHNETLQLGVVVGRLHDMSAPVIGDALRGIAQLHGFWYRTLPQSDNTPLGGMFISWFGRLEPPKELSLIHVFLSPSAPLQAGLLRVCDIPRRKHGRHGCGEEFSSSIKSVTCHEEVVPVIFDEDESPLTRFCSDAGRTGARERIEHDVT
jgi:hypothetical protein